MSPTLRPGVASHADEVPSHSTQTPPFGGRIIDDALGRRKRFAAAEFVSLFVTVTFAAVPSFLSMIRSPSTNCADSIPDTVLPEAFGVSLTMVVVPPDGAMLRSLLEPARSVIAPCCFPRLILRLDVGRGVGVGDGDESQADDAIKRMSAAVRRPIGRVLSFA